MYDLIYLSLDRAVKKFFNFYFIVKSFVKNQVTQICASAATAAAMILFNHPFIFSFE